MPRVVIVGNSGSGKSTLARKLAAERGLAHLDLDTITWADIGVRRPLERSLADLTAFLVRESDWVIEGCYASLIERALSEASELLFLDPGVEVCVRHNAQRAWEPHKYASKEDQDAKLEFLQGWVSDYYVREDEYSHACHLALFEAFRGDKQRLP